MHGIVYQYISLYNNLREGYLISLTVDELRLILPKGLYAWSEGEILYLQLRPLLQPG